MAGTTTPTMTATTWLLWDGADGNRAGAHVSDGETLVGGRGSGVDLILRDPGVSRRHFQIDARDGRLFLRDLGSKGGTYVDDIPQNRFELKPGNLVSAGASRLRVLRLQPRIAPMETGTIEVAVEGQGVTPVRRLLDNRLLIGRSTECDVVVDHPSVSRRHLEISLEPSGTTVTKLTTNNLADVNGRPFDGRRPISTGDRIRLAGVDIYVTVESPDARPGPVAVEIATARGDTKAVEIDASLDATVADVAKEVRRLADPDSTGPGNLSLCQPEPGLVLHPDNRWVDSGIRRGDLLELILVDETPPASIESVRYGPTRVVINPLPRSVSPPTPHRVAAPRVPDTKSLRGRGVTWQIVGGLGIIAAGLIIAIIRPAYALFALVGGIVGVISVTAGIMGEQSRRKHGVKQFRERLGVLDDELTEVRGAQTQQLRSAYPHPAELARWASQRDRRLWERRVSDPDFLRLRVGLSTRRALLSIDENHGYSDSPYQRELDELLSRHRTLDDAPVLTPSPDTAGIIGLVGNRGEALEVASSLVFQAAALHAPADVEMAIVAVNHDWKWARWFPHLESEAGVALSWDEASAARLVRHLHDSKRSTERKGSDTSIGPWRLVVIPPGAPGAELLGEGGEPNTLYLVLADKASDLPARADFVVTVGDGAASLDGTDEDGVLGPVSLDELYHEEVAQATRVMGRYVDGRQPARQTSGQLGLLELLGVGGPGSIDAPTLWANRATPPLSAVVGNTLDDEPLVLGFRSDGVHGVIGGTTGSGKSEFLQTLLMSLALSHSPTELSLFLIDFKGGATFAALADLPHVAGVVTDLEKDVTLANRAFTSLEAEMARRKRVLDEARVPGLIEYERLPEAKAKPMPALLVVIDEFALLVRQQPEVKERLDLVATQGRSLGVHLLLATQSPSNVITPSIRSNTQVWISLRVVDDSESAELLGHRDAARIPSDRPGRGFVRLGGSQGITGFQTARIARPLEHGETGPSVAVRPFVDTFSLQGRPIVDTVASNDGRVVTELEEACRTVTEQARRLGIPSAPRLWMDPLPENIPAPTSEDGLIRATGDLAALLGLRDDPKGHQQEPFSVDLEADGNLLVMGTRGSGKSTALRQVAFDLAEHIPPDQLHIYAVESGTGSMNPLAELHHTAAVVPVDDNERLYRTFGRLTRIASERRQDLAESGGSNFASWRKTNAQPEPWILLIVDDYPAFKEAAEGSGLGLLSDQLLSLCQGGPAVGIHVVTSSSQSSDMRMNLVNLFGGRVLLRQVDAAEYSLLDLRLRPNELPPDMPGRALVAGGYELQVFNSEPDRGRAIAELWPEPLRPPAPVERLEKEIRLTDIEGGINDPVIGVGGPEYQPIILDLDRGDPHLVIAGEGRSGRSTTLVAIAEAIRRTDPKARCAVFSPRPSPIRRLEDVNVATTSDEMMMILQQVIEGDGPEYLLIDDAEATPPEIGGSLEQVMRDAGQLGVRTLVAGRSTDLARSFENWIRYLLSLRSGLLLTPTPDGGFVIDVRLPASHVPMTPGRGFLCRGGEITFVQIGMPRSRGDA